ncbi:MAG: hypothetical protein QOE38_902, partial [Thermoleophilaceae bacterium]|nr:hypothetical protein [Thermoleophilaceae bacterium]
QLLGQSCEGGQKPDPSSQPDYKFTAMYFVSRYSLIPS